MVPISSSLTVAFLSFHWSQRTGLPSDLLCHFPTRLPAANLFQSDKKFVFLCPDKNHHHQSRSATWNQSLSLRPSPLLLHPHVINKKKFKPLATMLPPRVPAHVSQRPLSRRTFRFSNGISKAHQIFQSDRTFQSPIPNYSVGSQIQRSTLTPPFPFQFNSTHRVSHTTHAAAASLRAQSSAAADPNPLQWRRSLSPPHHLPLSLLSDPELPSRNRYY